MPTRRKPSHPLDTEERDQIANDQFAFPKERKEPLTDASHVRNAIARFDQVKGVSPEEKRAAFTRIEMAAKKFGIHTSAKSVAELERRGSSK